MRVDPKWRRLVTEHGGFAWPPNPFIAWVTTMSASISRVAPVCALVLLGRIFVGGVPVSASLIVVNTTADLVANDSQCSLREAITAANKNIAYQGCLGGEALPVVDVIELPAGTYRLDRAPMGDDANASGDLDVRESLVIRGVGPDFHWWDDPATTTIEDLTVFETPLDWDDILDASWRPPTIIEADFGTTAPGDGERVLHVNPGAAATSVDFELENLVIRGGDPGCTLPDCFVGAGALWQEGAGSLTVRRTVIEDNTISCTGFECGRQRSSQYSVDRPFGAAAIAATGGASVDLEDALLVDNVATCSGTRCKTGHVLLMSTPGVGAINGPRPVLAWDRTLFARNQVVCNSGSCDAESVVHTDVVGHVATSSVFWGNATACDAVDCEVQHVFTQTYRAAAATAPIRSSWFDIEFSGNRVQCLGVLNDSCYGGHVLGADSTNLTFFDMSDSRIADNEVFCRGDECYHDGVFNQRASLVALDDIDFIDNSSRCEGYSCEAYPVLRASDLFPPVGRLAGSLVRGSEVSCIGESCYAHEVMNTTLPLSKAVVSGNAGHCNGFNCSVEGIALLSGPQIVGSRFEGNALTCSGAGCELSLPGASLGAIGLRQRTRLIDTVVIGNTTQARGAGLVVRNTAIVQLIDSAVTGNLAGVSAGGVLNRGTLSPGGSQIHSNSPAGSDCVDEGPSAIGCQGVLLIDGFEFGDALAWSSPVP